MGITYASLLNLTLKLYANEGSLAAYQFISKHADDVNGNRAQIYNFRYALASASGLEEEALQIMKEAILDHGFWYGYDYLLADDDLKPLHKYDEFHGLVNLCKEREESTKRSTVPGLKTIKDVQDADSLIIALHGNQENIDITVPYWSSLATDNNMLAFPQSSQIEFSDGYVWDDVEKGAKEIEETYNQLVKQNNINKQEIIIGGFSAGARVALHALLTSKIAAKGFIFVAPWLPDLGDWEILLGKLKDNNIKGYIICGDQDEDCFECSKEFSNLLEKMKVPHTFKVIDGLNHEYPENFADLLKEVITYIAT